MAALGWLLCALLAFRSVLAQTLPTYQAGAATQQVVPNPFQVSPPSGALPTCPHVCLVIPYGDSADDVIAQFEQRNHCNVQTGDRGSTGGDGLPTDQDLQFSQKGTDLLQGIEELHLKPYDDQTGKTTDTWVEGATIGYGHLIAKQDWHLYKSGITKAEAEKIFRDDLAPSVAAVNKTITVPISQQQFDAMVILAFNIGNTLFENSSVAKLVNDPNAKTPYASLENAWKAWNKSQGKVNQGLINRRNSEWNIYTRGIYERW